MLSFAKAHYSRSNGPVFGQPVSTIEFIKLKSHVVCILHKVLELG